MKKGMRKGIWILVLLVFIISLSAIVISQEWSTETVDTVGFGTVYYPSIAVDSLDNLHMAYFDGNNDLLRYAVWTGSSWSTQTVESGNFEGQTSIAVDSLDRPRIVYHDVDNHLLKYAVWTGSSWSIEQLDDSVYGGVSLILDSSDRPHIVYRKNSGLEYAHLAGAWMKQTIDSVVRPTYTSIAVDSLDRPHISFHSEASGSMNYVYWGGSSWDIQQIDLTTSIVSPNSIALDSSDIPHIVYMDSNVLKYTTKDGLSWEFQTIDSASFVSIVLDPVTEYPVIAYLNSAFALKYAIWDGSLWSTETIDSNGGYGVSLTLDSAGNPHIGYTGTVAGQGVAKHAYLVPEAGQPCDYIDGRVFTDRVPLTDIPGATVIVTTTEDTYTYPSTNADGGYYIDNVEGTITRREVSAASYAPKVESGLSIVCDGQVITHNFYLTACDYDSDGFEIPACGGDDCDDENNAINTGATEVCDDIIDNDCDGKADLLDESCAESVCNFPGTMDALFNYNPTPPLTPFTYEYHRDGESLGIVMNGGFSYEITDSDVEVLYREPTTNCDLVPCGFLTFAREISSGEYYFIIGEDDFMPDGLSPNPGCTDICQAFMDDFIPNFHNNFFGGSLAVADNGRTTDYTTIDSISPEGTIHFIFSDRVRDFFVDNGWEVDRDDTPLGGAVNLNPFICEDIIEPTICQDADGDGYEDADCGGDDCDDNDDTIKPGATEVCDSVDNNCIDGADEGCDYNGYCTLSGTNTQVSSSGTARDPSVVFTGSEYGIAWTDYRTGSAEIYFAKLDSNRELIAGSEHMIASGTGPSLVWDGTNFAVAYEAGAVYFMKINPDGTPVAGSQKEVYSVGSRPSLAWNLDDNEYGLSYHGIKPEEGWTEMQVSLARLDINGNVIEDVLARWTRNSEIVWTGSEYGIATEYDRKNIGLSRMDTVIGIPTSQLPGSRLDRANPTLAWNGSIYGLAWSEDPMSGSTDINFMRSDGWAQSTTDYYGVYTKVSTADSDSFNPSMVWADSHYGIAWDESDYDIYFARVAPDGKLIGSNERITNNPERSSLPSTIWDGTHYGIAWQDNQEIYFTGISCCTDIDRDGYYAEGGDCGPADCDDGDNTLTDVCVVQCLDTIDNDGDFLIDFPDDPGCVDANDNDETDPCTDNDGDGYGDMMCGGDDCDDNNVLINPDPSITNPCNDCNPATLCEKIIYLNIPKIANVYKANFVVSGSAKSILIDVGANDTIEWGTGSLLNPKMVSLATAVNDSVAACGVPLSDVCRVPIRILAFSGEMTLSNIDIEYTNYFWNTSATDVPGGNYLYPDGQGYRIKVSARESKPFCGNGVLDQGEECDDNNRISGDGCTSICKIDPCGDGTCDAGETCPADNCCNGILNVDYLNDLNNCGFCGNVCAAGDECVDGNCINCGDGDVQFGEECDDGGLNSDTEPNACRTDCTDPSCGDGLCDDAFGEDETSCAVDCAVAELFCTIKPACDSGAGDAAVFSMFDLTDSHVGVEDYYNNQVCCNVPGRTLDVVDCVDSSGFVISKFQDNDAHVSTTYDYYLKDLCFTVDEGQVTCNVEFGTSGVCSSGACVATVFGPDNSHVADCEPFTAYPNTICCEYAEPTGCSLDADCNDGNECTTDTCSGTCSNIAVVDGTPCAGGSCVGGVCVAGCSADETDCSGVCVDTNIDVNNCGACDNACAGGEVCSAGVCALSCGAGETDCSGVCVDTDTDVNNCGACDNVCENPDPTSVPSVGCSAGTCTLNCNTPYYADCNGIYSDGCEVMTWNDMDNCGSCGNTCPIDGQHRCASANCNTLNFYTFYNDGSYSWSDSPSDLDNLGTAGPNSYDIDPVMGPSYNLVTGIELIGNVGFSKVSYNYPCGGGTGVSGEGRDTSFPTDLADYSCTSGCPYSENCITEYSNVVEIGDSQRMYIYYNTGFYNDDVVNNPNKRISYSIASGKNYNQIVGLTTPRMPGVYTYTYYNDGTYSTGDSFSSLANQGQGMAYTVAPGQSPSDIVGITGKWV
ncbi:DUF4215 domain-containing protein [candidate division KSB1 bacterium]